MSQPNYIDVIMLMLWSAVLRLRSALGVLMGAGLDGCCPGTGAASPPHIRPCVRATGRFHLGELGTGRSLLERLLRRNFADIRLPEMLRTSGRGYQLVRRIQHRRRDRHFRTASQTPAVEFKKFRTAIDETVPAELDVHVVCDNVATHKTAIIHDWLARHPRFHMHFTPTGSS